MQKINTDNQVDTWSFHWNDRNHNGGSTGSQQLDHHRSHAMGSGWPDGNYLRFHSGITLWVPRCTVCESTDGIQGGT
jgi:hypothetical protein